MTNYADVITSVFTCFPSWRSDVGEFPSDIFGLMIAWAEVPRTLINYTCSIGPPSLPPHLPLYYPTVSEMTPLQSPDVPSYDPELPLFSWEDVQPYLPISPHSRPSQVDNDLAGSSVASVLSACSYPLPERYTSQDTRVDLTNAPFYGGLMLEDSSYGDDHGLQTPSPEEGAVSHHPARMPSKHQRSEASAVASSSRRRGRPRKAAENAEGVGADEVCLVSFTHRL